MNESLQNSADIVPGLWWARFVLCPCNSLNVVSRWLLVGKEDAHFYIASHFLSRILFLSSATNVFDFM